MKNPQFKVSCLVSSKSGASDNTDFTVSIDVASMNENESPCVTLQLTEVLQKGDKIVITPEELLMLYRKIQKALIGHIQKGG